MGYFTDKKVKDVINGKDPDTLTAVHLEHQTGSWLCEDLDYHGSLCADILKGSVAGRQPAYNAGLWDTSPYKSVYNLLHLNKMENVRLTTVSSHVFMPSGAMNHDDFMALKTTLLLCATGNTGIDLKRYRVNHVLDFLHAMPGYLRIGEAYADGLATPGSSFNGPALIAVNPFRQPFAPSYRYYPRKAEVEMFTKAHFSNDISVPETLASYSPANDSSLMKNPLHGTSFSTPEAGRLVMESLSTLTPETWKRLKSYDIVPAMLLSGRPTGDLPFYDNNAFGLPFDEGSSGFGCLSADRLSDHIRQVADIARFADPALSLPETVETQGRICQTTMDAIRNEWKIKAQGQGRLVNVFLLLAFNKGAAGLNNSVPETVTLRSPEGFEICMPLLIDRQKGLGATVRAGFSTSGFFGEELHDGGKWTIACPQPLPGQEPYKIKYATLVTHALRPGSPGALLLDEFDAARRGCRAEAPLTPLPSALTKRPAPIA